MSCVALTLVKSLQVVCCSTFNEYNFYIRLYGINSTSSNLLFYGVAAGNHFMVADVAANTSAIFWPVMDHRQTMDHLETMVWVVKPLGIATMVQYHPHPPPHCPPILKCILSIVLFTSSSIE